MLQGFFLLSLVIWPFLAKVSLKTIPGFPSQVSFFIFQHGIHPIFSLAITGVLFLGLIATSRAQVISVWRRHPFYSTWGILWTCLLISLGVLQVFFVPSPISPIMQLGGLVLTVCLIFFYGFLIPGMLDYDKFIKALAWITKVLMILSILALAVSPGAVFKGTRFVGVFKHIPYMVSCAHLAVFACGVEWMQGRGWQRVRSSLWIALSLFCLFLTGTRSAVLSAGVFLIALFFLQPVTHRIQALTKNLSLFLALIFSLTLGPIAANKAVNVLTGQESFGMRKAQNGLSSRWDEIVNGVNIFNESPWLGHGLLFRFHNEEVESAGQYSSFRDPHNLFISAGVVGGWGLLIATSLSFVMLCFFSVRRAMKGDLAVQMLALYVLSHIPILAIYHVHLSLGGLADRIYWLVLGFLVFLNTKSKSLNPPRN